MTTVSAADEAGVIAGDVSLSLSPSSSACTPPLQPSPPSPAAQSPAPTTCGLSIHSIQVYLSVDAVAASGPRARATPPSTPPPPAASAQRHAGPLGARTPLVSRRGFLHPPCRSRSAEEGGGGREGPSTSRRRAGRRARPFHCVDRDSWRRRAPRGSEWRGAAAAAPPLGLSLSPLSGWVDSVQVRLGRRCRWAPARHFLVAFVPFSINFFI
uniref:Uncharacterized protein n=1 Tax=Setaria viridis TaxID=4556 RepID=A0A4U6UV95_SETVI|nr:hypothetical protein SEVIR_4G036601v2 [Setaria viridis]